MSWRTGLLLQLAGRADAFLEAKGDIAEAVGLVEQMGGEVVLGAVEMHLFDAMTPEIAFGAVQ